MKKLITLSLFLISSILSAQNNRAVFPQEKLNQATQQVLAKYPSNIGKGAIQKPVVAPSSKSAFGMLKKIEEVKSLDPAKWKSVEKGRGNNNSKQHDGTTWVQSHDTIFVGVVPNDTLIITGNWHHSGPILVLGNGVLIFYKATVVDSGDIYVFQQGQMLADSSSLTFPQQYFYQRSLIAVQTATVYVANSSFNYSGLSHNLVVGGNAVVVMDKVHQHDWTTCGLFGKPILSLNHVNQAGEYILMDSCTASFKNTDTLLLWHHFPDTAVVTNFTFPNGNAVYNYGFNKTVPGVSGIEYAVGADSCHDVMWAMMPVNGSNITISNSAIRAIGTWFQHKDTVNVSNLNDNSSYVNFTAPLADRNLHLINTNVQTWSLYVFDKSHIDVDSCIVGEVGTENRASVTAISPFLLDGSGGYFWATDTSGIFTFAPTVYSYVRSEKNGIFALTYGWVPFSAPQAIGSSVMISVQSNTAGDPVAYEAATTWLAKIDGPDTSFTNAHIPVTGSAWIDWGVNGSGWMNFKNYSLYYQLQGNVGWTKIVKDSLVEIRHTPLASWNTIGFPAGHYNLKLTVKNTLGDSVEAIKPIVLLNGILGVAQNATAQNAISVYPNPNNGTLNIKLSDYENSNLEMYNVVGQKVLSQTLNANLTNLNLADLSNGVYQIRIVKNNSLVYSGRVVKE
jgi:hypothetical protein